MLPTSLSELLTTEVADLEAFVALLGDERQALTGATAERLPDIATQKATLATRLSRLETARNQWLERQGHAAGRGGMETLLATRAPSAPESVLWRRLIELATQAKADNDTNGKLIALLLRNNQDALNTLLSSGGGSIYGADGQPRTVAGGRSFGSV